MAYRGGNKGNVRYKEVEEVDKRLLKKVKEIYGNGENIIEYLKKKDNRSENSFEDIMISYDFQAGTYVEDYYRYCNDELWMEYYDKIAEIISRYLVKFKDAILFEAGCGEGTALASLYAKFDKSRIKSLYGLDASFSRLMVAKEFLKRRANVNLIMGDMLHMPVCDNACDLVFTIHACEPNGGNEEIVLKELLRITRGYLILFEPAYDLAGEEARKRMEKHGYVTRLYDVINEMQCKVMEHHLLGINRNELNPTGVTVIEKNIIKKDEGEVLADPVSQKPVMQLENVLWSKESMLLFPRIDGINCMCENNAIIATQYEKFREK